MRGTCLANSHSIIHVEALLMLANTEVLALLLQDGESQGQILLREPDGRMRLQEVSRDSAMARFAMNLDCFRRGRPIVDPVTREVMGYEMEVVRATVHA